LSKCLSFLVVLVLLFTTVSTPAFAVTYSYKMNGGITNREYNLPPNTSITYDGVTKDYAYIFNSAVSQWNSAVEIIPNNYNRHVDLHFSASSSYANSEIRFAAFEFSEHTSLFGLTRFYRGDGTVFALGEPNQDWNAALCQLNLSTTHTQWTYTRLITLAQHEMGHGIGLNHSVTFNTTDSAMYSDPRYAATTPQNYDVNDVNSKY